MPHLQRLSLNLSSSYEFICQKTPPSVRQQLALQNLPLSPPQDQPEMQQRVHAAWTRAASMTPTHVRTCTVAGRPRPLFTASNCIPIKKKKKRRCESHPCELQWVLAVRLLCAKPCSKPFMWFSNLTLTTDLCGWCYYCKCYKWGKGRTKTVGDPPRVRQQ